MVADVESDQFEKDLEKSEQRDYEQTQKVNR